MSWDGQMPGLVPFDGAGAAGAVVLGGVWEADPVAEQEHRDKVARQEAAKNLSTTGSESTVEE